MRLRPLVISIAALTLVSCGKKEQPAATPPLQKQTEATPPAPDKSAAQEALGEQVLITIEQINSELKGVKDEQSAKLAATKIESFSSELEQLSEQMKQAGTPSLELADKFRSSFTKIERAHRAQVEQSMQTLQATPETVTTINRALQTLSKIRGSDTFKAYGF